MSEVSERIAFLGKRMGWTTLSQAAEAYGIKYESFKKIASHNASDPRGLTVDNALKIARFHKISPGWLMFNEGRPGGIKGIPLEGKIGAGQEMMIFENPGNEEPIPFEIVGVEATALEVDGDSMLPLARDGDIVFVGPSRKDIRTLVGQECAVLLEDGRRFFKVIENGSEKGRFDLRSYNAARIENVEIHSAGPLLAIRRMYKDRIAKRKRG
jgi:SOS-response transcriptional repressor LexA